MAIATGKGRRLSALVGAIAVVFEVVGNNSAVMACVYAGTTVVAAPVIVRGVIRAHNAAIQRLENDRRTYALQPRTVSHPALRFDLDADGGDIAPRPPQPNPLPDMIAARASFLDTYGWDAGSATGAAVQLDDLIRAGRAAEASFAGSRRPEVAQNLEQLADLDARLVAFRADVEQAFRRRQPVAPGSFFADNR